MRQTGGGGETTGAKIAVRGKVRKLNRKRARWKEKEKNECQNHTADLEKGKGPVGHAQTRRNDSEGQGGK